jgi:hypothetical protein
MRGLGPSSCAEPGRHPIVRQFGRYGGVDRLKLSGSLRLQFPELALELLALDVVIRRLPPDVDGAPEGKSADEDLRRGVL